MVVRTHLMYAQLDTQNPWPFIHLNHYDTTQVKITTNQANEGVNHIPYPKPLLERLTFVSSCDTRHVGSLAKLGRILPNRPV